MADKKPVVVNVHSHDGGGIGAHHDIRLISEDGTAANFVARYGLPEPGKIRTWTHVKGKAHLPDDLEVNGTIQNDTRGTGKVSHIGTHHGTVEESGDGGYVEIGEGPHRGRYFLAPSYGDQVLIKNITPPEAVEKVADGLWSPYAIQVARQVGFIPPDPATVVDPQDQQPTLADKAVSAVSAVGKTLAMSAVAGLGANLGWSLGSWITGSGRKEKKAEEAASSPHQSLDPKMPHRSVAPKGATFAEVPFGHAPGDPV